MRSLEYRTGVDFHQGLRCVQYRIPRRASFGESALVLAISLRYALVGIAAVKHLLLNASPEEATRIYEAAQTWPKVVADHFHDSVAPRLGASPDSGVAVRIADLADETMRTAMPLIRRTFTLEDCLDTAAISFMKAHAKEICPWWNVIARIRTMRAFGNEVGKSVVFAKFFFERRQCNVPEVPEIALLGE